MAAPHPGAFFYQHMNRSRLLALGAAIAAFFSCPSCHERKTDAATPRHRLELATHAIGRQTVETQELFPASIRGKQDVDIYPQVSGRIKEICISEGQRVSKGEKLFVIDQVPYQAALKAAEANVLAAQAGVESARLTLEGKRKLLESRVISNHEFMLAECALHSAEAQLQQAEAQAANARNNLSYTIVCSPAAGIAGTLPYKTGALVGPDAASPLTTISDSSEVHAYFSLPENRMLALLRQYGSAEGALEHFPAVQLQLRDGSPYDRPGRVESISGVADARTGSVTCRAAFPNENGVLRSGNSGNVLIRHTAHNALVIPQASTYELQDKVFAYKLENGHAKAAQLQVTALPAAKAYIVHSGLEEGDIIIAEGVSLLKDGAEVEPKEER